MGGNMKNFIRKTTSVLVTAVMIFSLAACSKEKNTETQPMQTITIGVMPDLDSIPLIIAEKNGYFQKAGVNVKIEKFKSAKDRDSALQSGKLDGVISDVLAVAFAKEAGFDIKITSKSDGLYKLLVSPKSKITSIEGLKGKDVAISSKTLIEYATDQIFKNAGVDSKSIHKVAIPQIPTRLVMLQEGKVEAAVLPEPLASVAVKNGAKVLQSTDKMGINPGIIAFTGKAINYKSREIQAVYNAYNTAVDYLQKEPVSKYSDVLVKDAGFPEEVKDTLVVPKYVKAVMPADKDINEVIIWMNSVELIKNNYTVKDLTDNKFIK